MNKVSIIMPIYNTEKFIEHSIQSVFDQNHQNFELILINDASEDGSHEFIDKIATRDDRVKTVHFNERKGVGAARNYGLEIATGDYIYFLDSDDYLAQSTLQLLIDHIQDYNLIVGTIKRTNISKTAEEKNLEMNTGNQISKIDFFNDKKYQLIKKKSVLNMLIRKSFIENNELKFSEKVRTYSELDFIIPALANVQTVPFMEDSIYYNRRRNDPITNPSLMQKNLEGRIADFLYVFNHLKDRYNERNIQEYLDDQFLNFYRGPIVRYFRKEENIDRVFDQLVLASKKTNKKSLKGRPYLIRKEIRTLRKGNLTTYKKINLRHHRIRKARRAVKGRRRLYIRLYRSLFMRMPLKNNLVVFESFLGKSYSDSPKYIYEYMLENHPEKQFVWIFNEKRDIPGNAIQVKRFSLRYFYYLARAKYWVSNSRIPRTLNKREGNIYLQTWHGTPLKTLVFDMNDVHSADPAYKRNFYHQSRRWDYLSSPNSYSSDIFRRAFKFEKEMLEFGYPRNDILYTNNDAKSIQALKSKLNLPLDKKVILYAPTWRDDEYYSRGKYKFTLKLELDKLQKQLGDEYIVLLRMHYFIASKLDISEFKGFAYNYSSYDDIAELYLISDILITDYSSVFFDFAHLKRPMLFYTYDLEKYRDKLRGFYLDIEQDVPGPLVKTTEQIIDAIKDIDNVQKEYKEKYESFYERFCKWDDGHASEKTVKAVFKDE